MSLSTRLSFYCKRFSKQVSLLTWNRVLQKRHVQALSRNAPVSLAYDRYKGLKPGTPLVIMHGMFGSKRNWISFCKSYNEMSGREIIAVDLRNHGDSEHSSDMTFQLMWHDIERMLIHEDIPKVILIGHSLGGKVAMEMALAQPNCVEKLVVVDVSHAPKPGRLRELQLVIQAMADVKLSHVRSRKEADTILARTIPNHDLRSFLLASLRRDEHNRFSWQLNLKGILDNLRSLTDGIKLNGRQKYEGDTMFVGGGNSGYIREEDLPPIREMFPRAQLEVVAGAGHVVHADKPKEFLNVMHDFLS